MADDDTGDKKKRVDKLFSDQQTWWDIWQDLADFLLPRKSNINVLRTDGAKQTQHLFDSKGVHAPFLLASSLGGTLISPAQQWFSLTCRQEALNKVKPVRDWLEQVAKIIYLSLNQSNFAQEGNEVFLDLAVFGTGAMFIEERQQVKLGRWGGFNFKALALAEYAIAEGPDGAVDTLARKFKMTAKAIQQKWPDTCPREIAEEAESDRKYNQHLIAHYVYPRLDRNPASATRKNMPWASCWFTYDKAERLDEGGFHEFPFVVPRWAQTSGEVYGRGPGDVALPDIRTLNRLKELLLAAGAKAVDPVLLQIDDGVTGSISLEPASVNIVREAGSLTPLESKSRWDVADWLYNNLIRSIDDIFLITIMRLRDDPKMTATQFIGLQEEMLRLLGPTAGRLQSEFLRRLIERCIALQYRAGALPPPPQILLEQGDIDVEYESPLARAQRSRDLTAIERLEMYRKEVRLFYPAIDDLYEMDKEGKRYAEIAGYPSDLLRDERLVASIREGRQQQEQAAQKLQLMAGAAKPAKDGADAMKKLAEVDAMQRPAA